MSRSTYRQYERGATALIIVIFSTLLFVIVSVGFMQLMSSEQRSSADDELSRGAYDSALAGIEDGKRVLKACLNVDQDACDKITANACTTVSDAGLVAPEANGEVYLKSSTAAATGRLYEQAYTCVKIMRNTSNILSSLQADESKVISLKTESGFDTVEVEWFAQNDSKLINFGAITDGSLPAQSAWPASRPPVLRLQLINLKDDATLDTLDGTDGGRTAYLYPTTSLISTTEASFVNDGRNHDGTGNAIMSMIKCSSSPLWLDSYLCKATVTLPSAIEAMSDGAYLRVTSLYNRAETSVSPKATEFVDVQPSIDSTGRAADVFRRVEARVESIDTAAEMAYPRATIDVTNSICKTFSVTDDINDYNAGICE